MNKLILQLIIVLVLCFGNIFLQAQTKEHDRMVLIPGGNYAPFFEDDKESKQAIQPFYIDKYAVTNAEYLKFVKENPGWRRSKVKEIFADKFYLHDWQTDLEPGNKVSLNGPVTNISWFAARAYAKWIGKRLPTLAEWEYVASASQKKADGLNEAEFKKKILDWYSKPSPVIIPAVKQNPPNYWKVYDMHGLIWEWVDDFNSILLSGNSNGSAIEKNLFCGGGSVRLLMPVIMLLI
jgi:formylglycine-generating enzyme required for sulfatase activity